MQSDRSSNGLRVAGSTQRLTDWQVRVALFVLGSLLSTGCTRPGLSQSADAKQAPIFQSAAPAPTTTAHTTADTALPLAGGMGSMIVAIGGLIVVVLGFRLVRQLAVASGKTEGKPPTQ